MLVVLTHWSTTALLFLMTIYALFSDDVRVAATSLPADPYFFSLSCLFMFLFLVELSLSSLVKDGYWLGLYFWLDLISTITMISDIGWVWEPILGLGGIGNSGVEKTAQLARAARASRAGTRAGRIIRLVRILRLIRLVRLYRMAQDRVPEAHTVAHSDLLRSYVTFRGGQVPITLPQKPLPAEPFDPEEEKTNSYTLEMPELGECHYDAERVSGTVFGFSSRRTSTNYENTRSSGLRSLVIPAPDIVQESEEAQELDHSELEESRVGQHLSEITTKRVILLVLGMLMLLPMFSANMYVDENTSYRYGLILLDRMSESEMFEEVWEEYIQQHKDLFVPVVYLEVVGRMLWESVSVSELRSTEQLITVVDRGSGSRYYVRTMQSLVVADLRKFTRLQAGLNIIRTVFVCAVLSIGSMMFAKDANDLVIGPIEHMIARVRRISKNPLQAAMDEEINQLALESTLLKKKRTNELETELLDSVIVKIGALLALGFGEAGTEIITANIRRGKGDIDPLIPGKKTYCIFGFCDIRSFLEVTEVLQEGVMLFVNEIAQVVHNTVFRYSGAINKNIGDAFLIVWKIPKMLEGYLHSPGLEPVPYMLHQYADLSLVGFLKVLAAIHTDHNIMKYRLSPELCAKLPNFSVKMGFGLHIGWAIEGAIGSEFKVDASYLSPNVNLASRLEAATRQFGVPILVSGQLYDLFSVQVQLMMRQVDCVMVKGSKVPIRLFTCDVVVQALPSIHVEEVSGNVTLREAKVELRRQRDRILKAAASHQREVWRFFESDPTLIAMREKVHTRFIDMYREAFEQYIIGNWAKACTLLKTAIRHKGEEDGPSRTLMNFMDSYGRRAPVGWQGFRELTEK